MIEPRTSDHMRELVAPPKRNDDLAAPIVARNESMRMREYVRELHPRKTDEVRTLSRMVVVVVMKRREQRVKLRTREP